MEKEGNNYAFIDSNNLNLGIQSLGWKLDFRRFRRYLKEKYRVKVAYMFIGYVPTNQSLYSFLQFGVGVNEKAPPKDETLRGAFSCVF